MTEKVQWATFVKPAAPGFTPGQRYKIKAAHVYDDDNEARALHIWRDQLTDFADEIDEDAAKEAIRAENARETQPGLLSSTLEEPSTSPSGIEATLAERGSRYGQFKDQAIYADKINDVYLSSPNWVKMAPDQREALRIIANKIGRILNGDPNYADNWHDIAGYAKLVDYRLNGVSK